MCDCDGFVVFTLRSEACLSRWRCLRKLFVEALLLQSLLLPGFHEIGSAKKCEFGVKDTLSSVS